MTGQPPKRFLGVSVPFSGQTKRDLFFTLCFVLPVSHHENEG